MADLSDSDARALGVAGYVIANRLLDELVKRNVLKKGEVAEIMRAALGPPVVHGTTYRHPEAVETRVRSKLQSFLP